ncbi:MAG: rubrerythrin family protein, partial [Clostridia bacterium]|nr:rubrerythrin family protein [Clostridia bacterium]
MELQTSFEKIGTKAQKQILQSQRDEETGHLVYLKMAKREKNAENRAILEKMAEDEKVHASVWEGLSGQKVAADRFKVWRLCVLSSILGYTFVLKRIWKDEQGAIAAYEKLKDEVPMAAQVQADEMRHEQQLIDMLDEERLQYVGSMVLGLNDALVELTGTIAGLSLAMMNTRLVALSGIITGISATLSMA